MKLVTDPLSCVDLSPPSVVGICTVTNAVGTKTKVDKSNDLSRTFKGTAGPNCPCPCMLEPGPFTCTLKIVAMADGLKTIPKNVLACTGCLNTMVIGDTTGAHRVTMKGEKPMVYPLSMLDSTDRN